MRIALLSGADKNAGDFLIVNRAKLLIEHFYPGCEIVEFKRNKSLAPVIDQANTCDAVVFAGGPGYLPNMYPEKFPLVSNLAEIRPPMFALGMGSWAPTPNVGSIAFTKKSRVLLERLEADGFGLGCRDRLSETLLKASGFESACFTGCPAWYDLERVGEDSLIVKPSRGGSDQSSSPIRRPPDICGVREIWSSGSGWSFRRRESGWCFIVGGRKTSSRRLPLRRGSRRWSLGQERPTSNA